MLIKMAIGTAAVLVLLLVLGMAGYAYLHHLGLLALPAPNQNATVQDLAFLKHRPPESRGRILAVVTSTPKIGNTNKNAGYELTELSRAYYVFVANGFEVDIASTKGGNPPVRIDRDDMQDADYAFLNDPEAQRKVRESMPVAEVDTTRYRAVYFVGGKGTMFDFPDNPDIQRIVRDLAQNGVVGAVCHGPAALLHVRSESGRPLLANRRITGFTNDEELFLMNDARDHFPYLLQDQAIRVGAQFVAAPKYVEHTIVDGNLITGQNPWSVWSVAKAMVKALGYTPIPREHTSEENSVTLVATYYSGGLAAARRLQADMPRFDNMLLLMHAVVAAMEWQLVDAFQLHRLLAAENPSSLQ